ncbi:MAG: helix-turn-helix domain-containing protein [Oscillospiraceae bacterium]|nr:helix-turn-helix domain-containing protein [Oscillospiraceae bacterium]MBQ5467388.1 helix-turn-helix domain-containing protein [Oscillospiraceae bacterium]MBQ6281808.1 helix-turn-helix domain-containing protein [Oscillospiraceae bacterium]
MLKDNLVMLRNVHGLSQEAIAEKIGISRQAYAKWETGATVPDVEKCALLAEAYGTTVDSLIRTEPVEGIGAIPPSPKGKNIWGSVAINDRGQIVIPKGARDLFGLTGGQRLIVLTDERGIALIPDEAFMASMNKAMELMNRTLGE